MRTLVDCGCVAHVHEDGSGIEIDYCPLHEAAPMLLKACQQALDTYNRIYVNWEGVRSAITKAGVKA